MKSLIDIFKEKRLEEAQILEKSLPQFKEPDEVYLLKNIIEAKWEFEVKEDKPIPPLNLMKFSKIFNLIEMVVEKEHLLGIRMLRNAEKNHRGWENMSRFSPLPSPSYHLLEKRVFSFNWERENFFSLF